MKAVLKTCKHPYKVSKATSGVKVLDILPWLAKNKEFGGRRADRKYWSLNKRKTEYNGLYYLIYVPLDISSNKYIINEEAYSSSSSSLS